MEHIGQIQPEDQDAEQLARSSSPATTPPPVPVPVGGSAEAVAFLKTVDIEGWHNLVHFPDGEQPSGRTFPPGSWAEMAGWIDARNGKGGLYWSVNEPRPNAPHDKLKKSDIGAIRCIPVDLDPAAGDLDAQRAELKARVDQCPIAPTILIDSGGGLQAFYVLAAKLPTDKHRDWAEDQGRGFARLLGGDAISNIDRIMRLPGTINVPTASKIVKGRIAREARVLAQSARTYTPAELSATVPPVAVQAGSSEAGGQIAALTDSFDLQELQSAGAYDELPVDLRERFEQACTDNAALDRLWRGELSSVDQSGSAFRAALARRISWLGFNAEDFVRLTWVWDHAVQPGDDREQKLVARSLARDWVNCGEESRSDVVARWFEPEALPPLFGPEAREEQTLDPFDFDDATQFTPADLDNIPEREFVLGSRFQPGLITVGVGSPAVSKSTFALLSAIAIATGQSLTGEPVFKTGPVLVYNSEDPREEMLRRLTAISRFYKLDVGTVCRQVRLLSGVDMAAGRLGRKLIIAERRELRAPITPGPLLDWITKQIATRGIVHVVLDPMIGLHANLDENSSSDMEELGSHLRRLAVRTGASIDLIHHSVKTRPGQSDGNAGDMNAARGSGAVMAFARSAYTLTKMAPKTAATLGIPHERATQMVRVNDAKRTNARLMSERWFELKSVLPGGEIVLASEFLTSDPERRRRAQSSVGVHVAFDLEHHQTVQIMEADETGEEGKRDALRRYILGEMGSESVDRTALTDQLMKSREVGGTTARKLIDWAVPEGRRAAAEVPFRGLVYLLWREKRGTKPSRWIVCREATERVAQVSTPEELSALDDDAEDIFA